MKPNWKTLLQQAIDRDGYRDVAKRIGYSATTLNQVMNGKYKHSTNKLARRVNELLQPRTEKPAQLKQLCPTAHKRLKVIAERVSARHCAELFGISPDRIWPLIRGTDKLGGADVLAALGTPAFSPVGGAL